MKWTLIWLALIAPAYADDVDENTIAHPKACAREGICYTWKQFDAYQDCMITGADYSKTRYAQLDKICSKKFLGTTKK